jgi:hypothetical protein
MSRSLKLFGGLTLLAVGLSGWMFVSRGSSSTSGGTTSVLAPITAVAAVTPTLSTSVGQQPAPAQPITASTVSAKAVLTVADGSERGARQAAAAIVALDEHRLRNDAAAESMTIAVASTAGRGPLVEQALRQSRKMHTDLGSNIVLLSQPLRVRTVSVVPSSKAEIDVWWVKVFSSSTLERATDIWGTTRVSLVWENAAWKEANEVSRLGPWPSHATDKVAHPSGSVFLRELDGFTQLDVTAAEGSSLR